jgi:hypothetical protein
VIKMSDADIARDLEIRKSFLFARARVLEEQMPDLCYKIAVDNSFSAKQELRALEYEHERVVEEYQIVDLAFFHAVKKSTQHDAHQVMRELGLGKRGRQRPARHDHGASPVASARTWCRNLRSAPRMPQRLVITAKLIAPGARLSASPVATESRHRPECRAPGQR